MNCKQCNDTGLWDKDGQKRVCYDCDAWEKSITVPIRKVRKKRSAPPAKRQAKNSQDVRFRTALRTFGEHVAELKSSVSLRKNTLYNNDLTEALALIQVGIRRARRVLDAGQKLIYRSPVD